MIWMDCRGLGFKTQKELKDFMFKDARVLLNDGTTFGEKEGTGFMRFNFAAPRAVVMEGVKENQGSGRQAVKLRAGVIMRDDLFQKVLAKTAVSYFD
ncbi:MAG: hypothetical protein ACLR0U_03295 [Enterocloster clostridioformis]